MRRITVLIATEYNMFEVNGEAWENITNHENDCSWFLLIRCSVDSVFIVTHSSRAC